MSDELHVCHLVRRFGHGGAEHLLVTLAERAAPDANMRLTACSLVDHDGPGYADDLRDLGIDVRTLGFRRPWDPRTLTAATSLLRSLKPDIVHAHLKHADIVGAYAGARLGIPYVSTLHMIEDAPSRLGRAKRRLAAQARLARADRTIAVSNAQRSWYLDAFRAEPERVTTIPNGVVAPPPATSELRSAVRAELGLRDDAVVVAMVALFRPGKGHAELLDAARRLAPDLDVQFVLAGDGPLAAELESSVEREPALARRVVFAGFQDDVPRLLAGCDLAVHPSLGDALPTSLIYALGAGVPVVATDVGGIPEIVSPDTGVLVRPADAAAMASALDALVRDPVRRAELGRAGRRRFERDFDASTWVRRLRALYDDVLAARPAAISAADAQCENDSHLTSSELE